MSENSALIVRNDSQRAIAFTEQANALKTVALEKSALIAKVETPEQQNVAVEAQRELATLVKDVEKARKAAKEPIIEFGRQIDEQAKRFVSDLADEQMRIATLVGSYQSLVQAKQRAEENARRLEAERIENERQAEIRRIQEEAAAQARRLSEEQEKARRAAQEATNAQERRKAQELQNEIDRQKAFAAAATHDALDAAHEKFNAEKDGVIAAMPMTAPVRAEGQRVATEWEITVQDIWLLAKAHPTCVKIEPRLSEIKALLNMQVKVAGVMAAKVVKSSVTANRTPTAIDV